MYFRIAVEDMEPNHWVAYALDLPGCFSSAPGSTDAVRGAPRRIAEYFEWLSARAPGSAIPPEPYETNTVETFSSRRSVKDPDYIVNAFFEDDLRPLAYWDVAQAVRLLEWTRADLNDVIRQVDQRNAQQPYSGAWMSTYLGILRHIAGAENWYYGHMGYGLDGAALPDDPIRMLEAVRSNTVERIWELAEDARIPEMKDEKWSARKVLRRALWHERDHIRHILQLTAGA